MGNTDPPGLGSHEVLVLHQTGGQDRKDSGVANADGAHGNDPLLTVREAAALLGLSTGTLNNWRWRWNKGERPRQGPVWLKVGRGVRYRRSAVMAWLEEAERLGESAPAGMGRRLVVAGGAEGYSTPYAMAAIAPGGSAPPPLLRVVR